MHTYFTAWPKKSEKSDTFHANKEPKIKNSAQW